MNIKAITDIVQLKVPDEYKERAILQVLAEDPKAIEIVLKLLNEERKVTGELLVDTNLELSRALVTLRQPELKWGKRVGIKPDWVVSKIIEHYKKWKHRVGCCFNIDELND